MLTETWLHADIRDSEVFPTIPDFTLYRHDRKNRRGGGVLIAIKNTLSSSLIFRDANLELIWLLVYSTTVKAVFGVCYRPPDSNPLFCDLLRHSLTNVEREFPNSPIFLFGDFNYPQICWTLLSASSCSNSNESKQFLDLTLDFNLHQSISCPTRGDNTLDLLLTSTPDDVKFVTMLPGFSDHRLMHICIALPLTKRAPSKKLITDYNKGNFDAINDELARFFTEFHLSHLSFSVNANWQRFQNIMATLKTKYIPTVLVKSDNNNHWFNKTLKSLLNRKKRLYKSANQSNNQATWQRYQQCAKLYIRELAAAKSKFFSSDLLSILQSNPSKFWRILSNKSNCNIIELSGPDHNPIDSNEVASSLNDYFCSVFSPANNAVFTPAPDPFPSTMPAIQINPDGISSLIRSLKLSSSAGCDQINSKLLKNTIFYSSQILHLIFLQSLETGTVPDDWKIAKIVPLFKSGNRTIPGNYRPISITSISSKLLEHIISSSLMTYLDSIDFFYAHQHGFRRSFSCETQLADFTHDILHYMDENLQTDAIFLDFSKAFDRVPHNLLLLKLSALGIPSNIISWIENFLTGRKQFTTANDRQSPLTSVTSGVPQGASLSPLLFLIYINDLPNNIKSKLKLFADDCVIYNPIRSPADNIILQEDLDTISSWCEKSLMPLNLSKCKILSFSRKHSVASCAYNINSIPIEPTNSYKYLGLHLTSSLSWVTHVETICAEASRTLGYLRRNLKTASAEIKKLAYLTFVRPKLEYASSIWHPSQAYLSDNLESIQNRATRFITAQYSYNVSITSLKNSLDLPSLASRRIISRLCLLHAFYYHPRSRSALLITPTRTSSRLSHSHPIARIKGRTSSTSSSFFPHAITLWNALPDSIVSCTDRKTFREKLNAINFT